MAVLPDSLLGLRDRAVLLFGFAGAFRRSELAALTTTDLSWRSEGLVVALHRAKEDQQGEGEVKAIPFVADQTVCPVRAVRAWAIAAGLDQGPLFRRIDRTGAASPAGLSGEAIAAIVKRAVAQAGKAQGWSKAEILRRVAAVAGHSLRAGYVTSAARAGIPEWAIMQHTGQRQTTTLRRYIRQGEMFATTPAKGMEW